MTANTNQLECYFCGLTEAADRVAQIGWIPSFWDTDGGGEVMFPVCPDCADKHIEVGEDGEYERVTE